MAQITIEQYFMGRDKTHADELTPEISANAAETVRRVNLLLELAAADGVEPGIDQVTGDHVASGWRPAGVNAKTANAAKGSSHLNGMGCDLQDHLDRRLAIWCLAHIDALDRIGLWMERPQWCFGSNPDHPDPWVHLQTRAVSRRVYVPSMAPAQTAMLPGEQAFA